MKALSTVALLALGAGCNAGPAPKDASAASIPVHNTSAVIENAHAVTEVDPADGVLELLREPGRDPRDVALDARYQAAELLTFLGLQPGNRVADLAAGGGYFAELFARAVGPGGRVFANQPPSLLTNTAAARSFASRLGRPANGCVVRIDRELASPLPRDARVLDLVYLSLPYRTAERIGVDTKTMNRGVFDALRAGGRYVVIDYRPRMSGPSLVNLHALHQEESTHVRRQVESAGLRFVTEGRFLRNDPRPYEWDAVAASNPTTLEEQDRFLLEFTKP
jgi:predicted methyltransferase